MTARVDVLLVEDDEAIAELYCLRLLQEDFHVAVARDGEEGLRLATSAHHDLIYLDLRLPKLGASTCCAGCAAIPQVRACPW